MLVFEERAKPEYPEKKPLGARERTNNKLNPHMVSMPGFVSVNKTSKQYKILFISSLCMKAGQGLKKNLISSLYFGQAFITFFLSGASSCSLK